MSIGEEEAAVKRVTTAATEPSRHTRSTTRELKTTVFSGFATALKKSKKNIVTFEDLYKAIPTLSKEDIKAAVVELDDEGKLHIEGNSIHQI